MSLNVSDKDAVKAEATRLSKQDTAKFVCTNAVDNNNKVWEFKKDPRGVIVKYGRVGSTINVEDPKPMTDSQLSSLIGSKLKKGYEEVAILAESMPTGPSGPTGSIVLATAARTQLVKKADPVLHDLVDRLVKANKHQLHAATGGMMDIDLTTGIISSPVGVLGKVSITEGRKLLQDLAPFVIKGDFDNPKFIDNLNVYLKRVPQKVASQRGWHRHFITDKGALLRQNTLLDQMEASADLAEKRAADALSGATKKSIADSPSIFDSSIDILTERSEIAKIEKMFKESINNSHETRHMKPIRFYHVSLPCADKAFVADPVAQSKKNVWELWHGTRVFNVLSILKSGLIIPKSGGSINVTGRMFGDGLYFSDQSTKSLNYSYGYWDGGSRDKNCFMFVFEVAMGNYYVPRNSYETLPRRGYDSTFAKGSESGVRNNEMIVYRLSQARPKYLIEFEGR